MTTNGSDRHSSSYAQGSFPDTNGEVCAPTHPQVGNVGELSRQMLSRLSQTIEGDIIPRLMLAFGSQHSKEVRTTQPGEQLNDNIDELVQLLLRHDASVATAYVSTLRSDGIPLSTLYLDLLAPAARRLGVMWEEDECSFTDVTIGVCRMHQVLLEFSRCFDAKGSASSDPGMDALIVPVPGEQHTFGIFMVMEFIRRAGWNCWSGSPPTQRQFQQLVDSKDFAVIGISVSADLHVQAAAELISGIRKGSRNSDAVIIAGGRAMLENPALAAEIGADAMAADGREAVRLINRLCRNKTGRST